MKNVLTLLLLTWLFVGCGQSVNSKIERKTYDQFITQHIELKDSLFILYSVKEWGKKNWYTWEDYSKMYKMNNDQVDYFIASTFYSPDRKKILIWLGEKKPNAATKEKYSDNPEVNKLCPNGAEIVYSLTALIGIRDSMNQVWKLYPFDQQQATCYSSKEKAINILAEYYFDKMKIHQMYRMIQSGKRKGHLELEAYGYNLQDKDFWDKCWLFQKDSVGSYNLYPFQIKRYNYNDDICTQKCAEPYNSPVIDYPEDILKLFRLSN